MPRPTEPSGDPSHPPAQSKGSTNVMTDADDDRRTSTLHNADAIILARRRAEDELAKERERLRITLASIGDAVISTDIDGRVTYLNGVAEALTGWSQADAVDRPLTEVFHIVHEHTRRVTENPALRALQEGKVVALANHTVLIARDGTERPIDDSAAPIRDESGAPVGAVLVFRDVSERKRAEELQARLAAIVESSDDAIVSKTLDGIIRTWNAGAWRLFGYTAEEAIGRSITLIIPSERLDEERAILARLVRGERVEPFETVRVARDGRQVDISLTVSPLRDPQGHIIGASKIARDIGERKRAEAALRASEARHRFLADLAAATQPLIDAAEVMVVASRLLAEHLAVDRCAYAEIEDESVFVITGDHARGVPSIVGRWTVGSFGEACARCMLANEAYVIDNVDADPRAGADLAAYRATTIQAVICVPLHKEGTFTAAMAVHQRTPRRWTPEEVTLVRTVVDRCWEALERSRVARTLRDSEARYRAIVESTPDCVHLIAPDGALLQMNPAGLAMIEADDAATVHGHSVYDLIAPEHRAAFQAFNERVCRGEPAALEYEIVARRGARRRLESTAVPLAGPTGGFTHLGVSRDVTERAAAEHALARVREREREHARLLGKVADASLAIHSAGSLAAVLRAIDEEARRSLDADLAFSSLTADDGRAQAVAAVAVADALGRPPELCAPPELAGLHAELCATNRPLRFTRAELAAHPAVRADGSDPRLPLRGWLAAPFVDRDGVNLGIIQLCDKRDGEFSETDEAALVQLAHIASVALENARLYATLRDQDRRKDEFLAMLAHELRNPLVPIRNGLQILRLTDDPAVRRRSQEMMDRQLGHMVRLVDDLLDVSRVSQNKMELRRARVRLADVVHSAVETARPLLDAARHALALSLPAEPVVLDADLTRLAQVFSNLLTNSAKYTEPGGHIRLTARARGATVTVAVQDDGIGIPEAALPSIFDMFSQVDRSIERSRGGLGIGLALVKGLVEMHGGTVTAESAGPGRGSTFTVHLPLAEPLPERPTPAAPVPERHAGPARRVLVVDDNQDAATTMAAMLELLGDEVRTAHDGLEALAAAEAFRPDVILMDVGMPRLNGYDATRRIRKQPWGRTIVIVALTGWGQADDRTRSRAAGCDGHLVKPVSLADLEALLTGLHPPPAR